MKNQFSEFSQRWCRSWAEHKPARASIRLPDFPAFLLARTVTMPPGLGYSTGTLAIRLGDLEIQGIDQPIDPDHCRQQAEGNRVTLDLMLEGLSLHGTCILESKPDPVIGLDVAGNLRPLPEAARWPVAAGGNGSEQSQDLDETQQHYLAQARDQRSKLQQTDNGTALVNEHYQHNEVFTEIFLNSPTLRSNWQANGVTEEMAADTSDAMTNNTVVNSGDKQYPTHNPGGVTTTTYNANALAQKGFVATACALQGESAPAGQEAKYFAAAKAAVKFSKAVATTNNSASQVTEKTPSEVYTAVNTADSSPWSNTDVSDDEFMQHIGQGPGPSGAPPAGDLETGCLPDETERKRLRAFADTFRREQAENADLVGRPLFKSTLQGFLEQVRGVVELELETSPNGTARAKVREVEIEIPAFALDLEDAVWEGEVADVARERLEQMVFIRSLLHDAIAGRLQDFLRLRSANIYNELLASG